MPTTPEKRDQIFRDLAEKYSMKEKDPSLQEGTVVRIDSPRYPKLSHCLGIVLGNHYHQ